MKTSFSKHHLTNRPIPRINDEKEIVIIDNTAIYNNPNESFTTLEDLRRWDLEKIWIQAKNEKKQPGIYIYNIANKAFVAYTQMNFDQLSRTCEYLGIPIPDIEISNAGTFKEDAVIARFEII